MSSMQIGADGLDFTIGVSGQTLHFTRGVVDYLYRHRQKGWFSRESGGQLFARFEDSKITVEVATGPRRTDRRGRCSYVPDRSAEQAEIRAHFKQGLHFIGDWHTHPQKRPEPSHIDVRSIAESVQKSKHQLNGFVHVVVGLDKPPTGWCVVIHDGHDILRLVAAGVTD